VKRSQSRGLTARAALARPLHPAALASVPSCIVFLVRVRVNRPLNPALKSRATRRWPLVTVAEAPSLDTDRTRNARVPTSLRSICFCAIWGCISPSSSTRVQKSGKQMESPSQEEARSACRMQVEALIASIDFGGK
jgi:hypothetical protein